MKTNKILLINTGGTIAGQVAEGKDKKEARKADDFSDLIRPTEDYFKETWQIAIEIEDYELCNIDSSDITDEHWKKLVDRIEKCYDDYDSFIITHGTNTLGYTCAALSFAIANLNKPVILTGSQVPSGMPGSDAVTNLNNALRVAVWPYHPVKGIVAVFGSHIITGTRVKKSTEFDYDAFQSFTSASIGRIGRIINIDVKNLDKHNNYLEREGEYHPALTKDDLIIKNDFDMRIASLTEFPGMSKDIFKNLVENNHIKGFVFRAFGAGDVSHRLHEALDYLKEKEIPIVVTTQAPNGNSNFQVNNPGAELKKKKLAIPAYDMSIESQTTKLAWLLAQKRNGKLDYSDVVDKMTVDYHGEINVLIEKKQ